MAWKGIGKPCRKVQPLIFKRGMLQFDSLLWARNFHALVPHTPMGFSLPAEAFLGSAVALTLRFPVRPVPSGSGLPSKSAPASEGARKGRGLVMGSPSSPSKTFSVAPQGLPSPGVKPPSLSLGGCIFYRLKLAGHFLSYLLCYFCSHVCCNMQGEAQNCQAP